MSQSRALELLREGIAAARAGDKARTRELLSQSTALDPDNEVAWLWYAGVSDSPMESLRYLEKVLRINPANERALAGIKTVRLQAGIAAAKGQDRSGARELLRQVVSDEPNNEVAWLWLAGVTDSPEEAVGFLRRVLQINPNNDRAKAGLEYYATKLRKTPVPYAPAAVPQAALAAPPALPSGPKSDPLPKAGPAVPPPPKRPEMVWTCPFCSAVGDARPSKCGICKAIQLPHQIDLNTFNPDIDRERIRAAVMKLTLQLRTRPDYASNYALGLACLNLGRLDESVHHFTAALRYKPDDEALALLLHQLEQRKSSAERTALVVPAAEPAPPANAPRPAVPTRLPAPRPPSSDSGSKRMILVVDDSPTIRKLVAMTMVKNGYRVVEAGDGNEALTRMQEFGAPDLVLLDINMPGMDGYTLCKLVRQKPETAKIPVIMLSGKDGFYNKIRGKMAGSTLYLTKPFQPDALLKVVQKYCPAEAALV